MTSLNVITTIREVTPNAGIKKLYIDTGIGTAADTVTVALGSYGMTTLKGISETVHVTDGSVLRPASAADRSVTGVSSGILTITLGTGNSLRRTFEILGV